MSMPMPHRTQMQLIKRRLVGKQGSERIRELRAILSELPDYRNGPYADIRKWVMDEIESSRVRDRAVHRDSIAVRREGEAQIALVGPPNAGKSSLLQSLSGVQVRTGDYAFTTLRPVPALVDLLGVPVQLVEVPGLIEGASEGRGDGRALLGVLRGADAIAYCHPVTEPLSALEAVRREVATAGIALPAMLVVTKVDDGVPSDLERLRAAVPDLPVVGVSILDDESLDRFRVALWRLTGLIRVYLQHDGERDERPVALRAGSTVADAARKIHNDLGLICRGGRVWGPSARFDGQKVGRDHVLADGDAVEVIR